MSDDVRPPRFDETLGAWLLTRHADVVAALRVPELSAGGVVDDDAAHAFPPSRLVAWRAECEPTARRMASELATGEPVDLVSAFAEPWSLMLAIAATGAPPNDSPRLAALARDVFLASARATDGEPASQSAIVSLARALPPTTMAVQAFVALSQTLPRLLAGAWHALLAHPGTADRLRAEPALMPRAIEELLRLAGPSRAVFRRARADVVIGEVRIAAGERVILMLSSANRDPARFPDPARLDVDRGAAGHLALGRGTHACLGAPVIRMAVAVATQALLDATRAMVVAGEVEWMGGFAIRGVASLPATLHSR